MKEQLREFIRLNDPNGFETLTGDETLEELQEARRLIEQAGE